jgi:hypothetical protein
MSTYFYFKTAEKLSFEKLREQGEKDGFKFGHMRGRLRYDFDFGLAEEDERPSIELCCSLKTCDPKSESDEDRLMTDGESALVLMVRNGNVLKVDRYAWCKHPANLLEYLQNFFGVEIESEYELRDHIYRTYGV